MSFRNEFKEVYWANDCSICAYFFHFLYVLYVSVEFLSSSCCVCHQTSVLHSVQEFVEWLLVSNGMCRPLCRVVATPLTIYEWVSLILLERYERNTLLMCLFCSLRTTRTNLTACFFYSSWCCYTFSLACSGIVVVKCSLHYAVVLIFFNCCNFMFFFVAKLVLKHLTSVVEFVGIKEWAFEFYACSQFHNFTNV